MPETARASQSSNKNPKHNGKTAESSKTSVSEGSQDSINSNDAHNICKTAELIRAIIDLEMQDQFIPRKHLGDLNALPVKQYLDATVIPILIQALEYLATIRPPEPINALCVYLLKYRDKFERKFPANGCNGKKDGSTQQEPPQPS